jgi:hypothetical protein
MKSRVVCAACVAFAGGGASLGQVCPGAGVKHVSPDPEFGGVFGSGVGIGNDAAIVGSFGDDDGMMNGGSAYVLRLMDGTWSIVQKITPEDTVWGDSFAERLEVEGDRAIFSAWSNDDLGFDAGKAYIYKDDGATWAHDATLYASDAVGGTRFGYSVAISDDLAVVGAPSDFNMQGAPEGAAYIFREIGPGRWVEVAKVHGSDSKAFSLVGLAVAVDGNTVVVGAPGENDNTGVAYVYREAAPGRWSEIAKLEAADGEPGEGFAAALAVRGDTIFAGVYADLQDGVWIGSVRVFRELRADEWTEVDTLLAPMPVAGMAFGWSLDVSNDLLAVGATSDGDDVAGTGGAHVFRETAPGVWSHQTKLTARDGEFADMLGHDVAVSDGWVWAGAPGDDDFALSSGAAYAFELACADECKADCDGNGALNILDFVCFQGLFLAADPTADCNQDGSLNILDFVCYQGAFVEGCS